MSVLQLSVKKVVRRRAVTLAELRQGEEGVLERLDVAPDTAGRLMELGFLPGAKVMAAASAPGGDPRIFRIDGSDVAMRMETARMLVLRQVHE